MGGGQRTKLLNWPPMTNRERIAAWIALGALGAFSQVAQGVLSRELLVVFYGNEVSLGAFFAAHLAWIGLGGLISAWALGREHRRRGWMGALAWLLILLPILLGAQVAWARSLRAILQIRPIELVPLGQVVVGTALTLAPGSLIIGLVFPLACSRIVEEREASRLYAVEALGALVGGIAFAFLLAPAAGSWRSIGVVAMVIGGAVTLLVAGWRPPRLAGTALVVVGLALLVTPLGRTLQDATERVRWRSLHPGLTLITTADTRSGHVALARLGDQLSLAYDGRLGASFPDPRRISEEVAYRLAQAATASGDRISPPRRVLLLGGGAGGWIGEILRYDVERIDVVEEDAAALAHIRPYLPAAERAALEDGRVSLHFGDGRRFLQRRTGAAYDLVAVLTPEPASARLNRVFTREFYQQARAAMTPGGVLCTSVTGAANYLGGEVGDYAGSVYRTLRAVFPAVVVTPADSPVMCAAAARGRLTADPQILVARYAGLALRAGSDPGDMRYPAEALAQLLPPDRTAFVTERLVATRSDINSDERPITYYLNLVLWGRMSSSHLVDGLERLRRIGPWGLLGPLLAGLCVWLLRWALGGRQMRARRSSARLAVAAVGFTAMALQLVLLLAYQARVGFIYGRITLLGGAFMCGLALGAGALGARLAAFERKGLRPACLALLAVLAAMVAVALLLPPAFSLASRLPVIVTEVFFFLLAGLTGAVTGGGFPLGLRLLQQNRPVEELGRSSGFLGAADHLGGALGGLFAGCVLVPLLGTTRTAHLLAALSFVAVLPLACAWLLPDPAKLAWLRQRARTSFPWPRFGWSLLALVAATLTLAVLARPAQTSSPLQFEERELQAVSGSERFVQIDDPFPHAIGSGGNAAPRETVSASSMVVAPDVRGYGGPMNLLVSIDDTGRLRGARLIESRETPSYIRGIADWLGRLVGRDLRGRRLVAEVDVMSGATLSSKASLEAIDRTAAAMAQAAFSLDLSVAGAVARSPWRELARPRFIATALLVLLFFPLYLWLMPRPGRLGERARLVYQLVALATLGLAYNTLVTEFDLGQVLAGKMPSLLANPAWSLLAIFAVATTLAWGPVYCGYVCPFGALQELLSRLGWHLGVRRSSRTALVVEEKTRAVKYLLLGVILVAYATSGDLRWLSANPMQYAFAGRRAIADAGGWLWLLGGVSLVGALLYYRFWCRMLCPMGALLCLGNKLALLRRMGPERRLARCDLGSGGDFHLDCLHCHRCASGASDLHPTPRAAAAREGDRGRGLE